MKERYERNMGAITEAEQEILKTKRAVIIGCGGLGCYSAEFLARIGIGHLKLVDGDVFAASNLNRQLNSFETNLGKNKAEAAKERLLQIDSSLSIEAAGVFLSEENSSELLKNHDIIIDALDSVKTRLLVEKTGGRLRIPVIHGAVEQWNAQVCTVFPGDNTLSVIYHPGREFGAASVLSFTPAFCASIQAAEAVKVLLGKENILRKKLLTADLKNNSFDIIEL